MPLTSISLRSMPLHRLVSSRSRETSGICIVESSLNQRMDDELDVRF